MKLLRIDNNKGYFKINNEQSWKELDFITKEDVLIILEYIMDHDDIEMDEFQEELVHNQAHNIIYKNLYSKFQELISNKKDIIDSTNQLFQDSIIKYSTQQSEPEM